ncbi:RHS repeat-associated core domain-containing protein [Pseudomonas sp. LJDD11]|uniref:RHS repeat-associated core domain-containing protein n=1 Tax=Pseudomonas sp. LJDD11 TaxID=2931984 RepID=UPI00211C9DC1|nr:RHS repeat-associated core domain-containing protein [Pseudomonas sp. LJDD11]MCQ9425378.1 RHS repeat-associated core domain-containing protein [Pseudomonas sp. LJDD11]
MRHSLLHTEENLLAQQSGNDTGLDTNLLATDRQRSVLQALKRAGHQRLVYTAYGYHTPDSGLASLLGFNGERRDPLTGHYLLGNGYRAFNPLLMRFNSPDSLSPFGKGGFNAYAYCQGDPVNYRDPHGSVRRSVLSQPLRSNPLLNRILDTPGRNVVRPNLTAAQATAARTGRSPSAMGLAVSAPQTSRASISGVAGSSVGHNETVLVRSVDIQVSEISRNQMLRKMPHVKSGRVTPSEYFKKPAGKFIPPVGPEKFRESEAGERLLELAIAGRDTMPEQGLSLQQINAAVAAVRS